MHTKHDILLQILEYCISSYKCITLMNTDQILFEFCESYIIFWYLVCILMEFHYKYGFVVWMKNSVDPDQLASLEAS